MNLTLNFVCKINLKISFKSRIGFSLFTKNKLSKVCFRTIFKNEFKFDSSKSLFLKSISNYI